MKIQTLTAENFRDMNQLLQWPCMRKQKFEELELSNLPEDCDQAIVHGVVTELLPIKESAKSRKYLAIRWHKIH